MNIISGQARNLELLSPAGELVRPTPGRARKALFDSLGDLTGKHFLDLCGGSGAMGLEAASRNADFVTLVEKNPEHGDLIRRNIARLRRTGVAAEINLITSDIRNWTCFAAAVKSADIIFADPPYADSAALFAALWGDAAFRQSVRPESSIIWELPDTPGSAGDFVSATPDPEFWQLRRMGGNLFWCRGEKK